GPPFPALPKESGRTDRCTGPGRSLPDAEAAEDPVEDIVGHHGADDFAEFFDGQSEVERDQLVTASEPEGLRGRSERLFGGEDASPAARGGAGRQAPLGILAP